MATKKKELLEQEAPVSETIALEDSPVPSEDTTAPDATPVDGEDLNALLAAMDQPDSAPPSDDTTSDLPELTEAEMFGDDSVSSDESTPRPLLTRTQTSSRTMRQRMTATEIFPQR